MRLVLISDTHERHEGLELPEGDVLVHAGDFSIKGELEPVRGFVDWLAACPHPHKVLVAGNHDFLVEREPELFRSLLSDSVTYLEGDSAVVGGLRFWGSPITPWFHDWAFNRQRGPEIERYWREIPEGTDVVVTHGPPAGILDRVAAGMEVGCEELGKHLDRVRPRLHVFGHVHEGRGQLERDGMRHVNASSLDRYYRDLQPPIVVDL